MVQLKYFLSFVFLALWVVVNGKTEIVVDGAIEVCGKDRSFDYSQIEIIPYNDTYVVLNGNYHHFCYSHD